MDQTQPGILYCSVQDAGNIDLPPVIARDIDPFNGALDVPRPCTSPIIRYGWTMNMEEMLRYAQKHEITGASHWDGAITPDEPAENITDEEAIEELVDKVDFLQLALNSYDDEDSAEESPVQYADVDVETSLLAMRHLSEKLQEMWHSVEVSRILEPELEFGGLFFVLLCTDEHTEDMPPPEVIARVAELIEVAKEPQWHLLSYDY